MMRSTLCHLLLSFVLTQSQNGRFQRFIDSEKCPVSRLDQEILEMRVVNQSRLFLPRLADLADHYPGERFTVSREKECQDDSPLCAVPAMRGACVGQDSKVSYHFLSSLLCCQCSGQET